MLLELPGPLSVQPLLVMPHVVLVTDGALVVLVVRALLLLPRLGHVSIVGAVAVIVLVRLLVNIGVLLPTIHAVIWRFRGWPLNL